MYASLCSLSDINIFNNVQEFIFLDNMYLNHVWLNSNFSKQNFSISGLVYDSIGSQNP